MDGLSARFFLPPAAGLWRIYTTRATPTFVTPKRTPTVRGGLSVIVFIIVHGLYKAVVGWGVPIPRLLARSRPMANKFACPSPAPISGI